MAAVTRNQGRLSLTFPIPDQQPGFSAAPLSGAEPLTVAFTDTSASYDGIVSWLWDFGDGQTSTEQNPNHEYARDGTLYGFTDRHR